MNLNRFLKTIFLTEFFLAIIKAIREIFRPKKTINYPFEKGQIRPGLQRHFHQGPRGGREFGVQVSGPKNRDEGGRGQHIGCEKGMVRRNREALECRGPRSIPWRFQARRQNPRPVEHRGVHIHGLRPQHPL